MMSHDVVLYVLTRTANRPKMFARCRQSVLAQDHTPIVHVVHAETGSDYAVADHVITGPRLPRSVGTAPWELHNQALLDVVAELEPGWVTFLDDDDEYTSARSVTRMLANATSEDVMPVWRVERAHPRTQERELSPHIWRGDLGEKYSALCWEAAAHHTSHIGAASIDGNQAADGRYWHQLSRRLRVVWQDEVLARPQVGKGKGKRRDY